MTNETVDQHPLSPPHSSNGDLETGAGRMDHYSEPYTPPRTVRPMSRNDYAYGSYGSPMQYPPIPQQVYYSPQPTFVRQVQYHTPPAAADPGIITRSGRTLGSPMDENRSSERSSRSPRTKKAKNSRAGKKGLPMIDQPLSILTKDYKIPIRDMGAWVNRPVEERMMEVEKKKGYVSRPMNSFMLYRSAYAERVKQFCKENNHQVVSQVTGQSWPLEPPHIREMYEQYAIIERDNHAAAHPNYKFAPNKSGKKRGRDDDDSDSDGEWRGAGSTKRSRHGTRGETRSMSSTPFEADQANRFNIPMYHQSPQLHPSSYQAINPHGPPPLSFGPGGIPNDYFPSHVIPYGQHAEDIRFGRMNNSFSQYHQGSHLIGMPDGVNGALLGIPEGRQGGTLVEQLVDPRLSQFDPNGGFGHFDGSVDQSFQMPVNYAYENCPSTIEMGQPIEQIHPGMATLTEGWPDDVHAGTDFDNEFQQWS